MSSRRPVGGPKKPVSPSGHLPDAGETLSDIVVEMRFFLCSYALLFAILAIRFTRPWLTCICGAIAIVGVVAGFVTIRSHRRVEPEAFKVQKIEDHGGEVAGYLATYLLPF